MGLIKTAGIVTKTVKYSDTSLIVTIITKECGKVSAIASGARTPRSRMLAGLQLFAYSEFVIYKSKSKKGLYHINEVTVAENFSGIREDLFKLAYASYFAEILNSVSTEEVPDEELLRLFLNTIFALDRELHSFEKIKTVYEWRIAREAGFAPLLGKCSVCSEENAAYLALPLGTALCNKCISTANGCAELTPSMQKLISYITETDIKNIFSFSASEETIKYISRISENYLKIQLDHSFPTLDYLKNVISLEDNL